MRRAIAIDFDGTLCTNNWPYAGEPNWPLIERAKREQANGAALILWTCREQHDLEIALKACDEWGLKFDAVNDNLPDWKETWGNDTRKIGANEYWDDLAFNVDDICGPNVVPLAHYYKEMHTPMKKNNRYPGRFRCWLFEVRWMWRNRFWKPSRQKMKRFEKDFFAFRQYGDTPW